MIKTKIKNLIESVPTLKEIGNTEIGIKTAFKIKRIIKEVESELVTFEELKT